MAAPSVHDDMPTDKSSGQRDAEDVLSTLQKPIEKNSANPSVQRYAKNAVAILKEWMKDHSAAPYPSSREIYDFQKKTGLKSSQISTWFSRERSRLKKTGGQGFSFKPTYNHPKSSVDVMEAWILSNSRNPTTLEKKELASSANLTLDQVSGWFRNKRQAWSKLHPDPED